MIRLLILLACAVPSRAQLMVSPAAASIALNTPVMSWQSARLSVSWDSRSNTALSLAAISLADLQPLIPKPWPTLRALGQDVPAFRTAHPLPEVKSGDIIFLDLRCGALCDAIAKVSQEQLGQPGPHLNHVGIVEMEDGKAFVWEAWPGHGVQRVTLREFIERVSGGEGQPDGFYVGRLTPEARRLADAALARVKAVSGMPYDADFGWGDSGMYCSKLVTLAFGESLFPPRPMYFGQEGSRVREVWRSYFKTRHMAIPDGRPGVSPLSIYLDGMGKLFQ